MSKLEINMWSILFLLAEWAIGFLLAAIIHFPLLISLGLSCIGQFIFRLYLITNKYGGSEEERIKLRKSYILTEGIIYIVAGIGFICMQFY